MSFYHSWRPYVPVAKRRQQAEKKLAKLAKKGQSVSPVKIAGRGIATTFWGKSWCDNLERYSDFANRLPRGRTYVRNGSVLDLQIATSEITALVSGSDLYTVSITVSPVAAARWKTICNDCAGSIDSLVELLQGRLSKGVMDRVCREGDGLFPTPKEIKLSCSCPDWADMCKHVAAALYGVGARLDVSPELLFKLRGVDETELIGHAGRDTRIGRKAPASAKVLDAGDLASVFGLDMAEGAGAESVTPPGRRRRSPVAKPAEEQSRKRTAAARRAKKAVVPAKASKRKAKSKVAAQKSAI